MLVRCEVVGHGMTLVNSFRFIALDVDSMRVVMDVYDDTLPYWKDSRVVLPRRNENQMLLKLSV